MLPGVVHVIGHVGGVLHDEAHAGTQAAARLGIAKSAASRRVSDLEDALIRHLETFLLELGGDFTFVGRQRRLRIDDEWYRVDLLFFHRA